MEYLGLSTMFDGDLQPNKSHYQFIILWRFIGNESLQSLNADCPFWNSHLLSQHLQLFLYFAYPVCYRVENIQNHAHFVCF